MEVCLFSSINTLRNEIKKIDDNLVQLIANRIDIVRVIGKLKILHDLPIKNEYVEQANLKRLTNLAGKKNISGDLINSVYLLLKSYAIKVQENDHIKPPSDVSLITDEMLTKRTNPPIGADSS